MAVRTVSVILTADIAAFRRRLGEASRTTTRTTRSMRDDFRRAGAAGARMGRQQAQTLKMVRGASIGLIAVFGAAVYAASKFEHAMAQVGAVTGASAGQMAQLRAAALEAGRTTSFSASQAAGAQHELAKAGVSVADIAGGALKGALNLAASAELEVAEAAEVAANAMTVFNLKGKDVGHVADVLAAAANKSTTDVHQLGMSLRMAGNVASQTGLSIEDTVGTLAMFAAQGMKGSDAGTSLKVMLMRLTPQSAEAAGMMEKLGFSAYDSQGRFVGLHEMARRLQESFSGLTPEARNAAMGVIFGADAVRAANIMYKYGEAGVRQYTDAVNDHGYAAAVAAKRLDSLVGDLRLLRSALEVALIQSGTAANAVMRDMVQWVTKVVNAYNALPPALQSTATLAMGMVGILGLVGASMLLFLPRVMAVRAELRALGITAATTRSALMLFTKLGLVLGAFALVQIGVEQLSDSFRKAPPDVQRLTHAMEVFARTGKVTGEMSRSFGKDLDGVAEAVARIAHPGTMDRLNDFMSTTSRFGRDSNVGSYKDAKDAIEGIDKALTALVEAGRVDLAAQTFRGYAQAAEEGGTSTEKFRSLLPKYGKALEDAGAEAENTAKANAELGSSADTTADELRDERTEAEKLADALGALNGKAISAAEAQISFQSSLLDLTDAVKENGTSLDVTGEKGQKVKQAFLDAAKAAQEHAGAIAEQTGSQAKGRAALEADISALKRTMDQAGFTDAQIRKLIGTFAQLPPKTEAQIKADTAAALKDLEHVQAKLRGTKGKSVTVNALTDDARKALENLGFKIKQTKGKKLTITAPTGGAKASVDALRRAIEALRDRKITITTNRVQVVTELQRKVSEYYTPNANGAIYKAFANGGREKHVAQIAQPTFRLWAEPETGGEAYIPLAKAKRGRSTAILAQVANEFGYRLDRYASGGSTKKTPQSVINARRELPSDFADFSRSLRGSASEIKSAAKAMATDLKKLGNAGWKLAGQVDKTSRRLQTMASQRDKVRAKIDTARQFAGTQEESAKDFLALGEGQTAYDLAQDLKKKLGVASKFRADIRRLEKRGIHKDLLAQVIEEGPGGPLAQKLLDASSGQFKELNKLAGKGSKLADYIGKTAADSMYDVGKYTANGFLGGLMSQEKALQKQMDKLGQSLINAIKKALKIKSPSQRARDEVGKQFGAGVIQGLDRMLPAAKVSAAKYDGVISGRKFVSRLPAQAAHRGCGHGPMRVTGTLVLDSGELMGAFTGVLDQHDQHLDAALAGGRVL